MATRTNVAIRVAVAAMTSLTLTLGGLVFSPSAAAATAYVTTGAVNVRSGPGTSYPVLGVLAAGEAVNGATASGGWVKLDYRGKTAYVSANYLTVTAEPAPDPDGETVATMVTTADLNLRTEPSLDSAVVKVLPKATLVTTTGRTSERFVEVIVDGARNWISGNYLAPASDPDPKPDPDPQPTIAYRAKTTAVLAMRTAAKIEAKSAGNLKSGTEVSLTGTHSGSYSQIVRKDGNYWVLTGYLATIGKGAPSLPKATGKRYVNVDEVNIRASSAADGKVVGAATQGMVLSITGKTATSRTQVIFDGAARWAYTSYLTKTKPGSTDGGGSLGSESLDRTHAHVKAIVRLIRTEFPAIKTMYGWRMSSSYSSDHPNGLALDIMIPKYSTASGKALGDKIARYLQENYKKLHVHYLIWRQRNWNVERNLDFTKGWRKMEDRGGATANHYDHVHVSVYAN